MHRTNRSHQHTLLSQQALLLNSIFDPVPPPPEPPTYRIRRDDVVETLKDRWNGEVESLVRRAQETDWAALRESWERRIARAWRNLRDTEAGREVETRLKENVIGVGDEKRKDQDDESSRERRQPRLLELK